MYLGLLLESNFLSIEFVQRKILSTPSISAGTPMYLLGKYKSGNTRLDSI